MNEDAETMASAAKRALEASRANTSLIALSSAEFQVALDPRPENRATVRKVVEEQTRLLNERVQYFSKTGDEKTLAMMPAIRDAISNYKKDLEHTLQLADATKDAQLTEQVEQLRASAMKSQAAAVKLRAQMRAAAEQLDGRVNQYAKNASDEYHTTSTRLVIVAIVGIIFGVLAGLLIGQFGIVRPIRLLKIVMEAFAQQSACGSSGPRSPRRTGRDGADRGNVQENALEVERMRATNRRPSIAGPTTQSQHGPDRGRFRKYGRRNHRDRVVGFYRTGGVGGYADGDCGTGPGS